MAAATAEVLPACPEAEGGDGVGMYPLHTKLFINNEVSFHQRPFDIEKLDRVSFVGK